MKVFSHILFCLIILGLGLISCSDEELEQEEGVSPFIKAVFINARGLLEVNTQIGEIDTTIASINERISEIDADENKGDLLEEKDSLNAVKTELNSDKASLNATATKIRNGEINLSTIAGFGSSKLITARSTDSIKIHTIPLNSNTETVRIFPSIYLAENSSRLDTIDFMYDLTTIFAESQIRVSASNLEIPFYSYDSILLSCKDTTCLSNEAQLTLYF